MMSSNRRTDSRTEISSCLYPSGWASASRLFASSDFLLACASSRTRPAISAASDKFPSSIFSCMSRNSASASCATSRALRTGSVSFSNRERNSAVRSWASSEPATSATTKTAAQKPRRAGKVLPLFVRELASQRSNTCGCLEVHVAVFVLVQFQEFLICIERQGHLVQSIVTSGANEPASRRRRFSLRQYIQAVQRGGVILAEIFRRHQILQHVGGLRIHSKCFYQFVDGVCVIFFLQIHMPQLRGKVGILRRQRDGLQQHGHGAVILFFAEINQRAQLQHAQRFGRWASGFIKLGQRVIVLARVHQQGSMLQAHGRVVGMRREVTPSSVAASSFFFCASRACSSPLWAWSDATPVGCSDSASRNAASASLACPVFNSANPSELRISTFFGSSFSAARYCSMADESFFVASSAIPSSHLVRASSGVKSAACCNGAIAAAGSVGISVTPKFW